MKLDIIDWTGKKVAECAAPEAIAATKVKVDVLNQVVQWQLAKRRQGTHATKTISMISGTTKKPYNQKGTGNARQGSLRSPQFRGGAVIFGPVPRSHEYSLNKKVRRLGLLMAVAHKAQNGELVLVKDLDVKSSKTADFKAAATKMKLQNPLFFAPEIPQTLRNATSNVYKSDVLPTVGLNVYDILNHKHLVTTEEGLTSLLQRAL